MHNSSSYPSSLTDDQWEEIQPQLPSRPGGGRPPLHHYRDILQALFYLLRTGCAWRYLPHDFAPWQTVYSYFRRWRQQGVWKKIHDRLVKRVRVAAGKKPTPSAGILDSQSVRCADQAGARGYDAGKKITGRKRHVLVDTLGLIHAMTITVASVQDRDGARGLLPWLCHHASRLRLIWADGGYAGALVSWVWRVRLEIVKRPEQQRGFAVLPKRWIVERTLGWLVKNRRLRCDYEQLPSTSETMIYVAMIRLMLRRFHP
jgi:putative transposase